MFEGFLLSFLRPNTALQVGKTDSDIIAPDYDVYIWDLEPGEHFVNIYNTVQEVSAGTQSSRMGVVYHRRLNPRDSSPPASQCLPFFATFLVTPLPLVHPSDRRTDTHQGTSLLHPAGLVQSRRIYTQDRHARSRDSSSSRYQA